MMNFSSIGIARAGAGTLAELSFKGIPSILIPYRYSAGHQLHNARWAENFGCIVLEEREATPENLMDKLVILETEIEKRKNHFNLRVLQTLMANSRYTVLTLWVTDEELA